MIGLMEQAGAPREPGYLSALTGEVFRRGGWLQEILGLEHRPQQEAMATAVATALEADTPLLFEAGTGVGKSLAYLVPGLLHSVDSKRPFIVSSHTISLQEQIRNKDLELCRSLFAKIPSLGRYASFKTALMVGRGNYCCSTRLSQALKDAQSAKQSELFASTEREDLIRIARWAAESEEGLVQELSPAPLPEVWDAINADSSTCSRKNCNPATCFYQRARQRLEQANCIILNHSLLFSLIHAGMPPEGGVRGVLLPDDFVVLDEAHRIPAIATDHFGLHASSYAVDRALKRLYNPRTARGILRKCGQQWDLAAVENAIAAAREFFAYLGETFLARRAVQRIHDADFCDNILSSPLGEVHGRLGTLIQNIDDERTQEELKDHRRRIGAYRDAINSFVSFAETDHVQWLERSGKKGQVVTLRSAPLDVAPHLRDALVRRRTAVVMTSATLSDGHRMDRFREQVGADAADAEIEYSPFNYKKNCRIFAAADAPEPGRMSGGLDLDYLAEMIRWCSRRVAGGTLVLFTSHADLRAVRERTEEFFRKDKRPLFTQGHDHGRSELTRRFAAAGNGVLGGGSASL